MSGTSRPAESSFCVMEKMWGLIWIQSMDAIGEGGEAWHGGLDASDDETLSGNAQTHPQLTHLQNGVINKIAWLHLIDFTAFWEKSPRREVAPLWRMNSFYLLKHLPLDSSSPSVLFFPLWSLASHIFFFPPIIFAISLLIFTITSISAAPENSLQKHFRTVFGLWGRLFKNATAVLRR